ncbi:hypothetical protein XU18_5074 [Perkinsela sp. CCAP 1560/4]|nr:hypothetical protein XU18_5074 [Perkinsela sp. CCAP 1560/4]|eukprot:KNH02452.1 hypothetical protein XU18_5074 [Perkinsela sp. CCAP 1560/4]
MQVFAKWYSYKDASGKPLLASWINDPTHFHMSDRQKGIDGVQRAMIPEALHFHCTLHISNNCKQYHPGKYDRNDIWAIQGCQTEEAYKICLNNLRSKCSRAADYITKIDPKT